MTERPAREDLLRCVWRENPILVQVLGMCSTLAITNSVANSLTMGLAVLFVLAGSNVLVAALKRWIPNEVRIATYIVIIATFVTVADMTLDALVPGIRKALGAFVPLIVANCLILARAEAFAARNGVWRSFLDAAGNGVGFTGMLLAMGTVREVIGNGTFLGHALFGARYQPWAVMLMPPGGFLTLGALLLLVNAAQLRRRRAPAVRAEAA